MDDSRYIALAGRVLLSLIFIISGLGKIAQPAGTKGYMAQAGMPAVEFFFVAAILFEVFGGLSLLLGVKAKYGAIALMVFIASATFVFHNFWAYSGAEQQMQIVNFLKNISIFGGLLLIAAYGPGAISFDGRRTARGEVR